MRILHVVPSYIPAWRYGGPIHSVHGLCKALVTKGHEVHVATTNVDGDRNCDVPLNAPLDLEGVTVHYFPSTLLRRLYFSPRMYRFMRQSIGEWDIVHTHSVFLWPTSAAAHLARKTRKPYVVSPRGMLVKDLIARKSPVLKRCWIELFERRNIEGASAIHVTSPIEGDELLALGLKPRRLFHVPNGLDLPDVATDWTNQSQLSIPSDYVLFLGRISWKKGLDRLISAMALVPGAALVVAGNDDEDYWPKMAQLAGTLGVSGRVYYVGFAEGKTKESLLAGAKVLVLPSYSENFGNVVLESMAYGVPVVVTPEVGLAHVVSESRSGLVSSAEPERLAEAIATLLGNEALRTELGTRARTTASQYSWTSIAGQFEEQYASIVGNPGA